METWLEKYYPEKATAYSTDVVALKHAIKKWWGLKEANRKAHNVDVDLGVLKDRGTLRGYMSGKLTLSISGYSCSLCLKYAAIHVCNRCPLHKHLDKPCDSGLDAPYNLFDSNNNYTARPMLKALIATLRKELDNANNVQ